MIYMVVGGQFGSEGKGSVTTWLTKKVKPDLAIRAGGSNSGHTVVDREARFRILKCLPSSWVVGDVQMYKPSGSLIDINVLKDEIELAYSQGYDSDIKVSPYAHVIFPHHKQAELRIKSGTTGSGTGAARAERCLRSGITANNCDSWLSGYIGCPLDILSDADSVIVIEGTQGYGLSVCSEHYPFTTSVAVTPFQILADSDIPPNIHNIEIYLVIRTFPIRIAGDSGILTNELNWQELRNKYGSHIPDEYTSVTQKLRRVGEFNAYEVRKAIEACNPTHIILTFLDYVFPNILIKGFDSTVLEYISGVEQAIGAGIDYVGIGQGVIKAMK